MESTDEVAATEARLKVDGMATATEDGVACCYAVQDKVWVDGPDARPWEIYTVLAWCSSMCPLNPAALGCAGATESSARCC